MRGFIVGLLFVGFAVLGVAGAFINFASLRPAVALEKQRVEHIVQNYVGKTTAEAQSPIEAAKDKIQRDPQSPSFGPDDARVVLVEFFDYRCPYCKRMVAGIETLIGEFPNVKFVFKELPILAPDSVEAAKAALAAHRQQKYRLFHQKLMEHQGGFDQAVLDDVAMKTGLDMEKFHADLKDPELVAQLRANHRLAKQLSIEGTPAFILGEQLIPGAAPIEELRRAIQRELESQG